MKILVVNCGSSSIKYKLYVMENHSVIAAGGIEKVGIEGSFLKVTLPDGTKRVIEHECPTHSEGIRLMFKTLLDPEIGAIKSLDEISAAGHRIVAGGIFTKSQIVTDEMIEQWKPFMELAPLHSEAHLKGYLAVKEQLPDLPQVFVFDTAFHQTMPPKAYMYALPYRYYSEMRIRRYGAHGTSHRYVTQRAGEFLNMKPEEHRFITCHIGNGASISAVDHGKCVDTSMGLTPLEGLMMGTRTGDIDASAILYIMEREHQTLEEAVNLLNKESGVLGITEMSSDMRIIDDAAIAGNERAQLALDMYDYRIKKYIGAYAAAMNGVDAIIFTAGVGEHQWDVREEACKNMEYLGVKLDFEKNRKNFGEEEIISTPDSKVIVAVIPTDEELLIAKDTEELVAKC
ncbi:acetate kinase [Alloprevotella tannerae]|uniref:acetate/propionate family kinase n=1 Tax=Alloprevotella tannerae TaxID=76122 RepID=UPI0028E9BB19|nr:acetate kinase [Alloprevotella tannerae]